MFSVLTRGALRQGALGPSLAVRTLASKSGRSSSNNPAKPPPSPKPTAPADAPSTSTSTPVTVPASTPVLSLDFMPGEEPEQKTGAKSSKGSLSSIERRRRNLGRVAFGMFIIAGGVQAVYMTREWEAEELKEKKKRLEDLPATHWGRASTRFTDLFSLFQEPAFSELLPPPMPAPHGKPYTLVLSIDDLLVKSAWSREHGWRTAKRPGVDYFLAYLSQFYEIVIFTSQYSYTGAAVIEKLDPYGMFIDTTHRLFRESTRSVKGSIVKDLSLLNRDLSKLIVVDTDADHVALQLDNAIIPPKWDGSRGDRGLIALIPFLESIGIYKPPDVRPIIKAYQGKDIPIEYAKREAEDKQKHVAKWSGKAKPIDATISSLFFSSAPVRIPTTAASASPVPLTYLEQKRKEAQALYLEEQAFITKNKDEFERLIEQDKQAMAAQMPDNLIGMLSVMTGGAPPPPPAQQQPSNAGTEGAQGSGGAAGAA
ncbi:HAD-like protein [Athelia psychrophila]|uniref:Mitochondrial import inner membrane translocase subunit TIM50 n=1 Tax=Athelia psychrophila TaxID=1759441 RepID=A0A166IQM5_9AGAM|nr:HAD-like protein [Fibularhizoctonia sp. CBS 109695]